MSDPGFMFGGSTGHPPPPPPQPKQAATTGARLGQTEIADALRGITADLEGKIQLAYFLALNHLADQVEALGKDAK